VTDLPTPFGYTVFSDDIREEVGEKLTFVGVYTRSMIVNADLPLDLPKFCIFARYYERPNESHSPVRICIFMPGDEDNSPTISEELPVDEVRAKVAVLDRPVDLPDPLVPMDFFAVLTPFTLTQEGYIKVRAYRDGQEIRLGALRVTKKA
jgi:hypothetical protein